MREGQNYNHCITVNSRPFFLLQTDRSIVILVDKRTPTLAETWGWCGWVGCLMNSGCMGGWISAAI